MFASGETNLSTAPFQLDPRDEAALADGPDLGMGRCYFLQQLPQQGDFRLQTLQGLLLLEYIEAR